MGTAEMTEENIDIPETGEQVTEGTDIPELPSETETPEISETPKEPDNTEIDGTGQDKPETDIPVPDLPEQPAPSEPIPEEPSEIIPEQLPTTPKSGQDEPEKEMPVYPDISDYLDEFKEDFIQPDRTDELTERLDTLILMLTPEEVPETEEQTPARSSVILPGYEELPYPVYITYGITTASGYSTYVSFTYDSSDDFKGGFEKMETDVIDGNLQSFYIRYVYDLDDEGRASELLYDSMAPVETPEPEPEPMPDDTTAQQILVYLESFNTTLTEMSAADTEAYQSVMEQQKELLELQAADVGSTAVLCIVMIAVLAEMTFVELFRRFK